MNTQATSFTFPDARRRIIHRHSQIIATAAHFPERSVSNQEIIDANHLPVTDQVVRKTLGVAQRRVADAGLTDSDLLAAAAVRCLDQAGITVDQLLKILVTKFIGDRILPMTASLVQRKLGSRVAMHAVDIEGGINAFLNALDLATRYISTTDSDAAVHPAVIRRDSQSAGQQDRPAFSLPVWRWRGGAAAGARDITAFPGFL